MPIELDLTVLRRGHQLGSEEIQDLTQSLQDIFLQEGLHTPAIQILGSGHLCKADHQMPTAGELLTESQQSTGIIIQKDLVSLLGVLKTRTPANFLLITLCGKIEQWLTQNMFCGLRIWELKMCQR